MTSGMSATTTKVPWPGNGGTPRRFSISQVAAAAALDGDQACMEPMLKAYKARSDFVVGAPGYTGPRGTEQGLAYLYYGHAPGPYTFDLELGSGARMEHYGEAVAGIGDQGAFAPALRAILR